jgi:adenylate cyclase
MTNTSLFDLTSTESVTDAEHSNQFSLDALQQHKQEGLDLAVRARWAALAVVAVLLLILNPRWEMIYPLFLLGLLGGAVQF